MEPDVGWVEIGQRITEARQASGLSQSDVARALEIDRTAVVRLESGDRKVSAIELFRLADLLAVPVAHFVTAPPAAIVSRRRALDEDASPAERGRHRLDILLEAHARDARWLIDRGYLTPPEASVTARADGQAPEQAVELARRAREFVQLPQQPLPSLASLCERFGLYLVSVEAEEDGASLLLDGYGVAVVNGAAPPGRRRWTAAHELGHHLVMDEYNTDVGVASSRDERERFINTFAEEFLVPEAVVRERASAASSTREGLVGVAAEYRVSWSVVVRTALTTGTISDSEAVALRPDSPTRGDFMALCGREPAEDLRLGTTGAAWRKAVLGAWTEGAIVAPRAVELLHGALTADDLPARRLEEPAP